MAVCSVCLDLVAEGEGRSTAMLACGHFFHLDCIGSAFNAKGRMQCPNCRGVEQGRWLYANACCLKEDLVDDSLFEEGTGVYRTAGVLERNYSRWCPYQGLYGHISLSHEEMMIHENGYADSRGTSLHRRHICPYIVNLGNIPGHTHSESSMPLHSYIHDGPWSQSAVRNMNHVPPERAAFSAHNGAWARYGGSFQSYEWPLQNSTQNEPVSHTNQSPLMFGFLREDYQSVHTRLGGTGAISQPSQNVYNPLSLNQALNLQMNNMRARHDEVIRRTARHAQGAQLTEPMIHGHQSWATPHISRHWNILHDVHGLRWTNISPSILYTVPVYWGAWASFGTARRNRAANPNRGGRQFGGTLRVVS